MPHYVPDAVCTNDIVAASKEGCVTAFSNYGEKWLNYLFTAAFGVVGEFAPPPPQPTHQASNRVQEWMSCFCFAPPC